MKHGQCYSPDWEGGMDVGDHHFDKDGVCVVCGETKSTPSESTTEKTVATNEKSGEVNNIY